MHANTVLKLSRGSRKDKKIFPLCEEGLETTELYNVVFKTV